MVQPYDIVWVANDLGFVILQKESHLGRSNIDDNFMGASLVNSRCMLFFSSSSSIYFFQPRPHLLDSADSHMPSSNYPRYFADAAKFLAYRICI